MTEELALDSLLERAAVGDSDAITRIVRRYEGVVRAAIHRRLAADLRGRVDTDDVFQSAMFAAVRELSEFEYRGEGPFVAWLTTVADWRARKAMAHHRAAKRTPRREVGADCAQEAPCDGTTPPERIERVELRDRVADAVARLPEPDATVVRLRTWEGLTFGEIAERTGLAGKDEARYVLQRGLRRLSEELDPE